MRRFLKEIKNLPFIALFFILAIIIFRISLFSTPGFKIDVGDWQAWTAKLMETGPLNFYTAGFFADYLPFFYIFLWIAGEIFSLFFGKAAIFSPSFIFYIKLISNFFDVLTAYTIFLIVKKYAKKWAVLAAILYLANPSIIFNSSVWGQLDSLPTFLFVGAIYLLEERKNLLSWGISNTLSFIIKPLNAPALPVMFIRMIGNFKFRQIILSLVFSAFIFFVFIIPFFPQNPLGGVFSHLLNSLNVYPYTSLNAYNFWGVFGWWKPDNGLWFGIQYHIWGYIFFALALLTVIVPYLKLPGKRTEIRLDYLAYTLSSFAFFLFLTRIHERYLFPVFALLLVSVFVYRSLGLFICYAILSIVNFINLFYSYYYYNVIYSNPIAPNNLLFDISDNYRIFFSLLSLFIFLIITVIYLRAYYKISHSRTDFKRFKKHKE